MQTVTSAASPQQDLTPTELVESHYGLAISLARRFLGRGERPDDLEQVALVALVGAARRYDPSHRASFATFATVSILGELKRHFRDRTWMMRVSRSQQELYLRVRAVNDEMTAETGRFPTPAEIAERLHADEEAVLAAMEAGRNLRPASLDAPATADGRVVEVGGPDHNFQRCVDRQALRRALWRLDDSERDLLRRVFFEELPQRVIASEIGCSQMQISRLLNRTLGKLRCEMSETS